LLEWGKYCNKNEMTHVSYKSKELNYQFPSNPLGFYSNPLGFSSNPLEFERTNYFNPNWSKNSIIIPISGVYIVNVSFNMTKVIQGGKFNVNSCLKLNNDFLTEKNIVVSVDNTGFTCDKPQSYRLNSLNFLFNKNDKLSVDFIITYTSESETPNLNYYILISLLRVG